MVPFPGKAPYPNALDGTDTDMDFDGDGLTLKMEYQAWNYSGRPQPLNYSDGVARTGGTTLRDGDKDVDNDGLTNREETTGPMRMAWWAIRYNGQNGPKETPYYQADRRYLQPSFVDPDSDGDGILDGNDDQDHDGYLNWFEVSRPSDWETTYTSTKFPFPATSGHTNRLARVNPYNPCKPINSEACHGLDNEPGGYYPRRGLVQRRHACPGSRFTRDAATLDLAGTCRDVESHRATSPVAFAVKRRDRVAPGT